MKIVVMGAPGCGKGTQSPLLEARYEICHLSTGDLLRAAVAQGTENGKKAKAIMSSGGLVSDDIVFGILKDAMKAPECQKGYIIDGLPRTLEQAQKMDHYGIGVDRVVHFDVPDAVIVERTSGRWLHRASGRTYHSMFKPPATAGVDDVTGEPLIQRPDDRREVVTKRLVTYHGHLGPIHAYYRSQGKLEVIDGNRPMLAVRDSLFGIFDKLYFDMKGAAKKIANL